MAMNGGESDAWINTSTHRDGMTKTLDIGISVEK